MNSSKLLLLFFMLFHNSLFSQIAYTHKVISEIKTDECLFSDQSIFGDGDTKKYRNRIINQEFSGTNYNLLIGTKSFEVGNPFCNTQINKDTLKIEYRVKGEVNERGFESVGIGQGKYREIQINISNIDQQPTIVLLNDEQIQLSKEKFLTFPEKYELLNGDTINRLDKYGQKQGTWIEGSKYFKDEMLYIDSKMVKGIMNETTIEGLKSERFILPDYEEGQVYYKLYFKNGEMKEENYEIKISGIFKKVWHPNGNLSQQNNYTGQQVEIKQYKENGDLDCKCITEIGVAEFKGGITCWNTNSVNIPCTFYDKNGVVIAEKKKEFALNYDIRPR